MLSLRKPISLLIPTLIVGSAMALANSNDPPLGHTGAPAVAQEASEPTCATSGCHEGNPLNTDGMLQILGIPAEYTPSSVYPITVRLTSTATQDSTNRRWGFELTAVRESDGGISGGFISQDLRVAGNGSRQYVTQNFARMQTGASSPVQWSFTWTAPAMAEGAVYFYAAGMAADGNGGTGNDFVYTTGDTTIASMTPVEPVTWGQVKKEF